MVKYGERDSKVLWGKVLNSENNYPCYSGIVARRLSISASRSASESFEVSSSPRDDFDENLLLLGCFSLTPGL